MLAYTYPPQVYLLSILWVLYLVIRAYHRLATIGHIKASVVWIDSWVSNLTLVIYFTILLKKLMSACSA